MKSRTVTSSGNLVVLAWWNRVDAGLLGEIKPSTMHVEAAVETSRDAGSIPAASIRRVLVTRLWPKQGPLPTSSGPCAFWPVNKGVSQSRHRPAPPNHVTG